MRMRGATRSTPGTASAMAAASRWETPSDFWRISFSSSSLKFLARTSRLRSPSRSIEASAWRSAPAPIDIMAITAPTPKIMPSMVSAERSLCAARLSSAERKASWGVMGLLSADHQPAATPSRARGGSGRARRRLDLGLTGGARGIAQGEHVAGRNARFDHDPPHRGGAELDLDRLEAVLPLAVDDRAPLAVEHRLAGHQQGVLALV